MNPSKASEKLVKPLLIGVGIIGGGVAAQAEPQTYHECFEAWMACYDNCMRGPQGDAYAACIVNNGCEEIMLGEGCYC